MHRWFCQEWGITDPPIERPNKTMLRIGDWCVNPTSGEISREGQTTRLEARTLRLLLCLAEHAGKVVSMDDLLSLVWPGVIVTQDSVYQAVAALRRLLGDDPKQPIYIATVPRVGYRMVATVSVETHPGKIDHPSADRSVAERNSRGERSHAAPPAAVATAGLPQKLPRLRSGYRWAAWTSISLALVGAVALLFLDKLAGNKPPASSVIAAQPQKSVAVLPFLDLTAGMKEEEFADGMTEELIDKLSKLPDLRVPAPTASFYFKNKKIPVADIAKSLGVAYVLDGSVRKSGATFRIATRLVRADNGYIIWSETYDRPVDDQVKVQDQIASEVAKALQLSIAGPRSPPVPSS